MKVYNFEVEDWHSYCVSELDVLVHNCNEEVHSELTLMQAAELAEHVYYQKSFDEAKGDVLPGGWRLFNVEENGSLRIGVYIKVSASGSTEYALVNRGTQNWSWSEDGGDNVKQPLGLSPSMRASLDYVRRFNNDHIYENITFVGHSKGGAEATANAVLTNRDAILFNPATTNIKDYGLGELLSTYNASMTVYVVQGEILNRLLGKASKPIGDLVYLPQQYPTDTPDLKLNLQNSVKNHSMSAVKDAIRSWEVTKQ